MANQNFQIICLVLICLGIYLFVSAPPPLEGKQAVGTGIPVVQMLEILKAENDAVRSLWTKEIVGMGRQAGLKFDEHWRDEGVDAGPLPALFLRETAKSLEKNPTPLSLFLGPDYPINEANRFERTAPHTLELLTSLSGRTQPASPSSLSENSQFAHQ